MIVFTSSGGLASFEPPELQSTRFTLYQNYPNPFNPTTKIRYTLTPSLSQRERVSVIVTLKVFDMLGREVATLANEEKPPGTYEVMWDASKVASGVYFYRMEAGGFVQTKKLLLLR